MSHVQPTATTSPRDRPPERDAREETERLLAAAWCGVLEAERVNADETFFAAGGDSLAALRLAMRLRALTGVEVSSHDLAYQSFAQLVLTLERRRRHAEGTPLPAAGADAAPRVVPLHFGPRDSPLFGCLHEPARADARSRAVVVCRAVGATLTQWHRGYWELADRLARDGFLTLRFDWFGTGDSAGALEEASVARWERDLEAAVAESLARGGGRDVCLVGHGLGAALAARAATSLERVSAVALYDPLLLGAEVLRELLLPESTTRWAAITRRLTRRRAARAGAESDAPARLCDEIAAIDLPASTRLPGRRVLVIPGRDPAAAGRYARALVEHGADVEVGETDARHLLGVPDDPYAAIVPAHAIATIAAWAVRACG